MARIQRVGAAAKIRKRKEQFMPASNVNGTSIYYEESGPKAAAGPGAAPPVVLLHGFPLDSRVWAGQRDALSKDRRVITPDLRGFGKSPSADAFTMESIADDVHALLADLGALPVILGGLSMGGYAALAYAKKYPADLAGLILIDTRAEADTPEGREARQKMIDAVRARGSVAAAEMMMPKMLAPDTPSKQPDVARDLRAIMESQPPRTIENALVALRDRPDFRKDLASIAVPTLILVGDADAITPPAMAETLHKNIPNSQLTVIRQAGHMTPMEQPDQVSRAIEGFVRSI
jgi:pimeloyl-ACP methyl ester carboxylesterase